MAELAAQLPPVVLAGLTLIAEEIRQLDEKVRTRVGRRHEPDAEITQALEAIWARVRRFGL